MHRVLRMTQPQWHIPKAPVAAPVLKVFNSLTRSKDEFVPAKPEVVSWYSCGPTVYDSSHMGHARNYVTTDISRRILQDYFGYNIVFVQNVTDIDDKIIVRARQNYLYERYRQEVLKTSDKVHVNVQEKVKEAVLLYTRDNLKPSKAEFSDQTTINELQSALSGLNLEQEKAVSAKFPMHYQAVTSALSALADASSIPAESFLENSKTVLLYLLDKQQGATVTDPKVFRDLAAYWEHDFNKDMASLNVLPPSVTTRVSEYVPEIVTFVEKIVANGFAYATDDGSVYFDTAAFEADPDHHYAKLQPWNKGQQDLIDEGEGSLSLKAQGKRSRNDFALWKASKPGEPFWPSPWGEGRPGWHIECSVMASEVLGSQIDIHSGGIDLAFPHHDNELAQSEACHGCQQWINYFLHTGHLHIEGQKMSKSLKNFITIKEGLKRYGPRQMRLAFALQQWNAPFDLRENLAEVRAYESTVNNFFTNVRALTSEEHDHLEAGSGGSKKVAGVELELYGKLTVTKTAVDNALRDNLSTPVALAALMELVQAANAYLNSSSNVRLEPLQEISRYLTRILGVFGFPVRADGLGWADNSSSDGSASAEDVARPFLKVLSKFRDEVRNKAIAGEPIQQLLAVTDRVRDYDLLDLGVSLDDRAGGEALVKFVDANERAELVAERDEKLQREQDKAAKKAAAAEAERAREEEKKRQAEVKPEDLFRTPEYSAWDEQGIPTADADGEPVTKSMRKKLTKQWEQQSKLYKQYHS